MELWRSKNYKPQSWSGSITPRLQYSIIPVLSYNSMTPTLRIVNANYGRLLPTISAAISPTSL